MAGNRAARPAPIAWAARMVAVMPSDMAGNCTQLINWLTAPAQQIVARCQRVCQTMPAPQQPDQGQQRSEHRRDRRTGRTQPRQAGPAQDQQWRAQQSHPCGQQQRVQWRLRIAHRAAYGGRQPQQEEGRRPQQQHARIGDGLVQDRCRRTQCCQQLRREEAAHRHHQHRQRQHQRHRAACHRSRLVWPTGAPGLADQHHRTGRQAHHQRQQQEKSREECGGGGHGLRAKQVPQIDVVQCACGQLQRIGQQHRKQQGQIGAPQRLRNRRSSRCRRVHRSLWARRCPARRFS
ncbi:hypothetical protein G6F35_009643 [Rhizopus arrhizus]|nr:hypothetical protein G6F35_009643 [Rhizopus arrhizus]